MAAKRARNAPLIMAAFALLSCAAAAYALTPPALRGGGGDLLQQQHGDDSDAARHLIASSTQPQPRPIAAAVVFRHGARSPLAQTFYPSTTYKCDEGPGVYVPPGPELRLYDPSAPPGAPPPPPPASDAAAPQLAGGACRAGTLTREGYAMAVALGARLRARYVSDLKLLPADGAEAAARGAVAATTTTYRRTVATLRGVLAGLYPSGGLRGGSAEEEAGKEGGSGDDAFPVAAAPEVRSFFYASNKTCGALAAPLAALSAAAAAREAAAPQETAERVLAALGLPSRGGGGDGEKQKPPLEWPRLRDEIACSMAEWPDKRPPGLTDEIWRTIDKKATEWEGSVYGPGPRDCPASVGADACARVIRLAVGPLIARLLDGLEEAAAEAAAAGAAGGGNGDSADGGAQGGPGACAGGAARLALFSGHDTTLLPLLAALGAPAARWPPFAAHLAAELWLLPSPDGSSDSDADNGGGGGGAWVRLEYGGAPLAVCPNGSDGSAAPADHAAAAAGGGQHHQQHWRRAEQEYAQSLPQQQHEEASSAAAAAQDCRRGWLSLAELRRRLRPYAIDDGARAAACWPAAAAPAAA